MHRSSIYIAEKDKAVQQYLGTGLKAHGFATTIFDNGYPIVTMMDNWPDIFLIDIQLSDINGLEVCKWLKTHESSWDIPVILLSGDPYLKLLAGASHADDYIEKPLVIKNVISHIRECLLPDKNKVF